MVILGLGSNLGDRLANIYQAQSLLADFVDNIVISPIYESPALLQKDAPKEWDIPFLNAAVKGYTTLLPAMLLSAIKNIEQKMGRQNSGKWAPREIDIDILAYGEKVIEEEGITIPHPSLLERDFALCPLADLVPNWCYPVAGKQHNQRASSLAKSMRLQPYEPKKVANM